jgi:hypothetical protein
MALFLPQPDGSTSVRVGSTEVAVLGKPGLQRAVNVLRVAANVADTETVVIGQDTYEFDRAANGVTAGRIAVTAHADDTPTNATDALIAKINTSGTERVTAVDIGNNEILLVATDVGAIVIPCTETMAGTNNAYAANAMYGGSGIANTRQETAPRFPTTQEVNLGNLHFYFDFTVKQAIPSVIVTSTGTVKKWDGNYTITGPRVTLDNTGSTDWATTDTVTVTAFE